MSDTQFPEFERRFLDAAQEADSYGRILVLDGSRKAVLSDSGYTIWTMLNGEARGRNRNKRLLLGRKGVGKTSVLDTIGRACMKLSQKFRHIAIEYTDPSTSQLPLNVIMDELHIPYDTTLSAKALLKVLEKELIKQNLYIFLSVDEIQRVYSRGYKPAIMGHLASIAEDLSGRIHCIIAGSSSVARKLVFGKLKVTDQTTEKWPNYLGHDYNSTKFKPQWIYPLVDPEDFDKLIIKQDLQDHEKIYLYTFSSGYPSLVQNLLPIINSSSDDVETDTWTISLKDITESELSILNMIVDSLAPYMNSQTIYAPFDDYMQFVPLDDQGLQIDKSTLYDMADDGIIRLSSSGGNYRIGLGTTQIYQEVARKLHKEDIFTTMEIFSIFNPEATIHYKNAEFVTLKNLAMHYKKNQEKWSWNIKDSNVSELHIYMDSSHRKPNFKTHPKSLTSFDLSRDSLDEMKNQIMFVYYKQNEDSFGSDGIIINWDGDMCTLHLLQIKLGFKKEITESELTTINDRFSASKPLLIEAFNSYFKRQGVKEFGLDIKHYLVTTKSVPPTLNERFPKINVVYMKKIWCSQLSQPMKNRLYR